MTSLNSLDALRVLKALRRFGWEEVRSSGSHRVLKKDGYPLLLTVPVHRGRPIKQGTMRKILKTAAIAEDDFLTAY